MFGLKMLQNLYLISQTQCSFKFQMHPHPNFEVIHNQLLNRNPLPLFDDIICSVIAEEPHLNTLFPQLISTDIVFSITFPRSSQIPSSLFV